MRKEPKIEGSFLKKGIPSKAKEKFGGIMVLKAFRKGFNWKIAWEPSRLVGVVNLQIGAPLCGKKGPSSFNPNLGQFTISIPI